MALYSTVNDFQRGFNIDLFHHNHLFLAHHSTLLFLHDHHHRDHLYSHRGKEDLPHHGHCNPRLRGHPILHCGHHRGVLFRHHHRLVPTLVLEEYDHCCRCRHIYHLDNHHFPCEHVYFLYYVHHYFGMHPIAVASRRLADFGIHHLYHLGRSHPVAENDLPVGIDHHGLLVHVHERKDDHYYHGILFLVRHRMSNPVQAVMLLFLRLLPRLQCDRRRLQHRLGLLPHRLVPLHNQPVVHVV
mmetsp:Transcript_24455/g.29392  ORF Transcript_24455/g.29392 Transcript_24455/m.29392 type:complete len:242 (+) Transcript_24455:144-869(+)